MTTPMFFAPPMTEIPFTGSQNQAQTQNFSGRFIQPIDSTQREYDCRDCAMKLKGAGTLALHVVLRHGRQSYVTWVERTFQTIQNRIEAERGTPVTFNHTCPVPECTHSVGDTQQLVDFHLMYSHARDAEPKYYIEAYNRQRELWERTYSEVRGYTARNQAPVVTAGPF